MDECYSLISEVLSNIGLDGPKNNLKRKFCDSSSDESWDDASSCISSSSSPPFFKKSRVQDMRLPSLTTVFVDAVGSPH